ncbi:MAG: ferritin family protein [bacterium]|nr:ferritin family protein [bacterium]
MTSSRKSYATIQEFIQQAAQFEAESAAFYKDLKERIHDAQARELLDRLAKDELAHQKTLEAYEGREHSGILQFPPNLSSLMPPIPSEQPAFDECVRLALDREKKSIEIYENAAKMVTGDFRDILQGLADFERQHVAAIMKLKQLLG